MNGINLKNVIVCEPKYYDKFTKFVDKEEVKQWVGFKIVSSIWCDEDKAYLFDHEGNMTTIIIEKEDNE